MKTLLLAGYRHDDDSNQAPGLQTEVTGGVRLDRRVLQLRELGLEVICVLSGEAADQQIRRAPSLEDVELVFDTNAPDVSIATNLRAGLAAAGSHACFCLPVEVPWPSQGAFEALRAAAYRDLGGADVVQIGSGAGVEGFGFPLLITPRGAARLAGWTDLAVLTDPRVDYLYLNV